jgi:tRNA-splicing ligase RtcB (3'-phosphate/5'-hydroxy nucleic acid ligase)
MGSVVRERGGMQIRAVEDCVWEIAASAKPGMQAPARVLASPDLLDQMDQGVFEQLTNVACLPGIVRAALCMPDGHWGYGFPIGGVAAFRSDTGVISPGGIGFDINCGMRLIRTELTEEEVRPRLRALVDTLFALVPCGVGASGFVRVSEGEFRQVMVEGAAWCVGRGYGRPEDLECAEAGGRLPGADPEAVSARAVARGINQLGTLGSGNHYLEIQVVRPAGVHDGHAARTFGVDLPDQVCVMLHCGSRGFGHQIGTDYLRRFDEAMPRYGIAVPDRELACAPFRSPEGQAYFGAMTAAANTAFANRQVITHRVREAFERVFGRNAEALGVSVVYDVCHNTAKLEHHQVDGRPVELVVHRKGATRAFGPGAPDVPRAYREVGQPVIIGGSMETGSALLAGTARAMAETFGSTAHGAGRTMSRAQARKRVGADKLIKDMEERGVIVRAASRSGLAEEAGFAYKDLTSVVDVLRRLDISRPVVSLTPIGNIKG